MAGNTVPIDFWVEPSKINNNEQRMELIKTLVKLLEEFGGPMKLISDTILPGNHYLSVYGSTTITVVIKQYKEGLVSTNLEYIEGSTPVKIHLEEMHCIEDKIRHVFNCSKAKVLPAIKRAPNINPYFTTSDNRLVEYDLDALLFEEITDFQKVQIVHSSSFGNILVLDDLQNLAESDLPYTHGLMNKGVEFYKDKEILILGGGDGALLHELLKEDPKFVTMIDIDEAVVTSCRKYLRTACEDAMDNYEGERHKIIIGDAIQHMKEYLKVGRKFDYVFGDLTDVPISKTAKGDHWDFLRSILNLGTNLLVPNTGKYMTHAIGIQCTSALKMFESQIEQLDIPNSYTRTNSYVPSFMENWVFYQITRNGA